MVTVILSSGCRLPGGGEATQGKVVQQETVLSNATVGSLIMQAISQEPKLKDSQIAVSVSNLDNAVILTGVVVQPAQESLAVKLAQAQAPGRKVTSQIQVSKKPQKPTAPPKKANGKN